MSWLRVVEREHTSLSVFVMVREPLVTLPDACLTSHRAGRQLAVAVELEIVSLYRQSFAVSALLCDSSDTKEGTDSQILDKASHRYRRRASAAQQPACYKEAVKLYVSVTPCGCSESQDVLWSGVLVRMFHATETLEVETC